MKNLMLGTAIALVFGSAATAQDLFRTEMDPVAITASGFIGKRVYAAETASGATEYAGVQDGWNDIGEINDVILTRDGKVDAVLVDIGGFLGIGERQVALGMENIRFVSDSATAGDLNDYFLVVSADRSILEGAPEYIRTGAMPATPAETTGTAMADPAAAPVQDTAAMAGIATPADGKMMADGFAPVKAAGITADKLKGVRVYGPNDEDVGEISEIVLDAGGVPAQVIVDVGGFLGLGEKPVVIELTAVQLLKATDGDALRAYVSLTQDELEKLPAATM